MVTYQVKFNISFYTFFLAKSVFEIICDATREKGAIGGRRHFTLRRLKRRRYHNVFLRNENITLKKFKFIFERVYLIVDYSLIKCFHSFCNIGLQSLYITKQTSCITRNVFCDVMWRKMWCVLCILRIFNSVFRTK